MLNLTKEQKETIEQLMKTSADDVIDKIQSATNIQLAHSFLEKAQNNEVQNAQLAQIYSNLALVDQLVLMNRTLSLITNLMIQSKQSSGLVVPQMKLN